MQFLDKCLKGNTIAPLWHTTSLALCSALVPKACSNLNAPLTLTVSVVLLALGYNPNQIRDFMLSFITRFGLLPAANGKLFF